MKFKQLDFELYVREILEEYKSEKDITIISDIMACIVMGVAEEIISELEEV